MDENRAAEFTGRVLADSAAAATIVLAALGDRTRLFKDMAEHGPATSGELAGRTGLPERYVREWLGGMFTAGYLTAQWHQNTLVQQWLPLLPQISARLRAGARVADVGCGTGQALIALARAFPAITATGYDMHPPSVEQARRAAVEAGLADRVSYEVLDAAAGLPDSPSRQGRLRAGPARRDGQPVQQPLRAHPVGKATAKR
jgi:SAM-dependent methyltransferase